jgi:hypothetical protein
MSPKTLAIPSPIEITVPNSLRSFYEEDILKAETNMADIALDTL